MDKLDTYKCAGENSLLNCPKAQPAKSNVLSFVKITERIFRGVKKIFKKFFCLGKFYGYFRLLYGTTNNHRNSGVIVAEKR